MPTSNYFRNYDATNEQQLFESLHEEYIQIHGIDTYYVHRTIVNRDDIFSEDALSKYERANEIEMYAVNYQGYGGEGAIMSQFGLEMRDSMTFALARKRFREEMALEAIDKSRPMEGDLVYFPLQQKVFQIKFVDDKHAFFQWGDLPLYYLSCELFEYSGETFNTGIEGIDRIQTEASINILDHALLDSNNNPMLDANGDFLVDSSFNELIDPFNQSQKIQDATDFIDFSEADPFSANGVF